MRTRGEGVKKSQNFADVIYGWPHKVLSSSKLVALYSIKSKVARIHLCGVVGFAPASRSGMDAESRNLGPVVSRNSVAAHD